MSGFDSYDAWKTTPPAEYGEAPQECDAPNCRHCGGCEARCDSCVACKCVDCAWCGDLTVEHTAERLAQCKAWLKLEREAA